MLDCIGSYWMTAQSEMVPHLIIHVSSLKITQRTMFSNCPRHQTQTQAETVTAVQTSVTVSELAIALAQGRGSDLSG